MSYKLYFIYPPRDADERLWQVIAALEASIAGFENYAYLGHQPPRDEMPLVASWPDANTRRMIDEADRVIFLYSAETFADYYCMSELKYLEQQNRHETHLVVIYWRKTVWDDIASRLPAMPWPSVDDRDTYVQELHRLVSFIQYISMHEYRILEDDAGSKLEELYQFAWDFLRNAIEHRTTTYDIFISYAHSNKEFVQQVRTLLEQHEAGFRLWLDEKDIPLSRNWQKMIYNGIAASGNCLFFISYDWLASEVCHDEFRLAKEYNKRISIIFLEETIQLAGREPETAATKAALEEVVTESVKRAIKREHAKWDEESARIDIRALLNELKNPYFVRYALNMHSESPVTEDLLAPLIDHLRTHSEHINQHTQWLVLAHDYYQHSGPLLSRNDVRDVVNWIEKADKDGSHPSPALVHREYLKASKADIRTQNYYRGLIVVGILVVFFGLILFNQARLAQLDADAQRDINREIANSAQTLAQTNLIDEIDVPVGGLSPLLFHDRLWVPDADTGAVNILDLRGEILHTVPIGGRLSNLVPYGGYVWVTSATEKKLFALSATDMMADPQQFELGIDPGSPQIGADSVWVRSRSSGTLWWTDVGGDTLNQVNLGLDLLQIYAVNDGLVVQMRDKSLQVVDPESGATIPFAQGRGFDYVVSSGSHIWVSDGTLVYPLEIATATLGDGLEMLGGLSDVWQDEQGSWWFVNANRDRIVKWMPDDPKSDLTLTVGGASFITETPGLLWVFGADTIAAYDINTGTQQASIAYEGAGLVQHVIDDGQFLWVSTPGQPSVLAIDYNQRDVARVFQPCLDVVAINYDGVNIWFTCGSEHQLLRMPAWVYSFGDRDNRVDSLAQPPIVRGQQLWILRTVDGRLVVYDFASQQVIVEKTLVQDIIPLVDDGRYLWTADASGTVYRIDPTTVNADEKTVTIETIQTPEDVQVLEAIAGKIWALHDDPGDPFVFSVIEPETMTIRSYDDPGLGVSSLIEHDGYVWMYPAETEDPPVLSKLALDGTFVATYPTDDVTYGGTSPAVIGDDLWYPLVLPPLLPGIMTLARDAFELAQEIPVYLGRFDTATGTWHQLYPIPAITGGARWDGGDVIWLSATSNLIDVTAVENTARGAFFGINITDGTIYDPHFLCTSMTSVTVVDEVAWVGCLAPDTELARVDPATPNEMQVYDDLGSFPWPPAFVESLIWFSFRDSESAASFDNDTGELLATRYIGRSPSQLTLYDGWLYVYNAGDDTLIRISPYPVIDNPQ